MNLRKFYWLRLRNPVIRKGETKSGGFKWTFRRFWLDISTLSGNFKCRFMADEHPYGYLLAGKDDSNIIGFAQTVYYLSKTLTTDQGLVNDIKKAFDKYEKRLGKVKIEEDEGEEIAALEFEKQVQEYVEKGRKKK